MRKQTTATAISDIENVVKSISKTIDLFEKTIFYLYNTDPKIIQETVIERKNLKLVGVIESKVVWPVLDTFEEDDYIELAGLSLIFVNREPVRIVSENKKLYIQYMNLLYPLTPFSLETSLLLILNRGSLFVKKVAKIMNEPDLLNQIEQSISIAPKFYRDLEQLENKFLSYYYATGYRSFLSIIDKQSKLTFSVIFYNIGSDTFSYYKLSDLYVSDIKKIEKLVSATKVDELKLVEVLTKAWNYLQNIHTYLVASYVLTKVNRRLYEDK